MRFIVIATAMLVFTITGCNFFKHAPASTTAAHKMLDSASILDGAAVKGFVVTPDAAFDATKLYLNGIELFINKKDAQASLPVFLQSLRLNPVDYVYLKYADAVYATGNLRYARSIYNFVSGTSNNFRYDALLGEARCLALDTNSYAFDLLEEALAGFPFEKEFIETDPAFQSLKNSAGFKILLTKYFGDEEDRMQRLLAVFEENFPEHNLPFELNTDSVLVHRGNSIDYRFVDILEDLAEGEFSREVSKDFQYVASFNFNPAFKTVIYRAVDMVADTMNPVFYYMATFDTTGELLFQRELACFCSPLTIKTCTINADGVIEVKEIAQVWKEDPLYKGYEGNEVTQQEVKAVKRYVIGTDGTIEEESNSTAQKPEVVNIEKATYN